MHDDVVEQEEPAGGTGEDEKEPSVVLMRIKKSLLVVLVKMKKSLLMVLVRINKSLLVIMKNKVLKVVDCEMIQHCSYNYMHTLITAGKKTDISDGSTSAEFSTEQYFNAKKNHPARMKLHVSKCNTVEPYYYTTIFYSIACDP